MITNQTLLNTAIERIGSVTTRRLAVESSGGISSMKRGPSGRENACCISTSTNFDVLSFELFPTNVSLFVFGLFPRRVCAPVRLSQGGDGSVQFHQNRRETDLEHPGVFLITNISRTAESVI